MCKKFYSSFFLITGLVFFVYFTISSCKKDDEIIVETDTILLPDTVKSILNLPNYILAGQTSGVGILYTDVNNDTLKCSGQYSADSLLIDINADGIIDFKLGLLAGHSPGATWINHCLYPLQGNELVNDSALIIPLNLNDSINYDTNTDSVNYLYGYFHLNIGGTTSEGGLWKNAGYKYAGVKMMINQTIRYGWIGLEYIDGCHLVLHDYACTVAY